MKIDIVIGCRRDLKPLHHMAFLVEYWREKGHQVRVVTAQETEPDGDVGLLHIDLTRIPSQVLEWAAAYPVLINGRVPDISKRLISRNLVAREDGFTGPVIVKTDLNRGGKPELYRHPLSRYLNPIWIIRRAMARRGYWQKARTLPPNDYPVFVSQQEVPEWIWSRPDLIVERFLPERHGDLFASRIWVFFGKREYARLELTEHSTARGGTVVSSSYIDDIPQEVRSLRSAMGIEFGKIDWAMTPDGPVVYDVNRTPSRITVPAGEDREIMVGLSEGLESLV